MRKVIGWGAALACLLVVMTGVAGAEDLTVMDYEEIRNLYSRYSHAFDGGDGPTVADTYTADGQFVMGGRVVADGRAALLAQPRKPQPDQPSIRHLPANIEIKPSPDGAKGRAYVVLLNVENGELSVAGGGVYEDDLVKTGDGWRFKQRTFTPFGALIAAGGGD